MKTAERATLGLIFGGIGGFIGWFLVDIVLRLVPDIVIDPKTGKGIGLTMSQTADMLFFGITALCMAVGLAAAEAAYSGSRKRFWRDAGLWGLGAIGAGILGSHFGNSIFDLFLGGKPLNEVLSSIHQGNHLALPGLLIGRAIGWMLIGGFIGLAGGLMRLSTQKMKVGLLGGLAGGFAGGLLFDPFSLVLHFGAISRMVVLTVIGASIGGAIALVENLFKQAWVVVLLGRNEGRHTILANDTSSIGRDELCDVGVFGDQSVAPRHATLQKQGDGYLLIDDTGSGINVNGKKISRQMLRDGDVFQLGNTKIEFHEKGTRSPITLPAELEPEPAVVSPPMPSNLCPFCGQKKDPMTGACACTVPGQAPVMTTPSAGSVSRLIAVSGPFAGQQFALNGGPIRIGREPGREICPQSDSIVSRRHAVVQKDENGMIIRDEGSSNGTFVNGARITQQALHAGDEIRIGESLFRVE